MYVDLFGNMHPMQGELLNASYDFLSKSQKLERKNIFFSYLEPTKKNMRRSRRKT